MILKLCSEPMRAAASVLSTQSEGGPVSGSSWVFLNYTFKRFEGFTQRGKLKKKLHLIDTGLIWLKDEVLISQGRKKTLAVLKNSTDQPVEVVSEDNKKVFARPI